MQLKIITKKRFIKKRVSEQFTDKKIVYYCGKWLFFVIQGITYYAFVVLHHDKKTLGTEEK